MRALGPALALVAGILALSLGWNALRDENRETAPRATPTPAPRPATSPSATPVPRVGRDLLRYEEPARAAPPPSAAPRPRPTPSSVVAPPPAPPAQRLVGFVRRQGRLYAVLSLPGADTVVAALGDSVAGHTLLALDEEHGARLRLPDGSELSLPPPE